MTFVQDALERHDLTEFLHPRVVEVSRTLFLDGHFKSAAQEGLIAVEVAMKEKAPEGTHDRRGRALFGRKLVERLVNGKTIILESPLPNVDQKEAGAYFTGTFGYYRNYLSHQNVVVSPQLALRILALASDLLFLVAASTISFDRIGGVEGVVESGRFASAEQFATVLRFVDDYTIYEHVWDGFWEELAKQGLDYDSQFVLLLEYGLYYIEGEHGAGDGSDSLIPSYIDTIRLTPEGEDRS